MQQIFLHAAHGTVNRHIVVVEHDEQIVGRARGIVEPLKGESAAHGTIARNGHHMAPRSVGCHRHAECSRDGVAGMSAGKRVVFAFHRCGERTDAVQLAVGVKLCAPSRQNLMSVGLMPHIPHDAVVGRVKHIVQCHREFHYTQ